MISHSPLRHLHLFRFRLRFIIITALISSFGSAIVGLLAPYLYTSTSTIQVETKSKQSQMSFGDDGVEFHKAALLIESPQILAKVADKLVAKPLDARYYFPRAISAFDLTARLSLLLRHLGYQPPATALGNSFFTAEVVTSLLAQHVQVVPDYRIHTISISYEAGSPDVARAICSYIVEAFIELSNAMEKEELRRQEKYLLDSIDRQLASIRHLEQSMQAIVEEHPSMTSAQREQGRGATLAAQRLLDKKERLQKIEQELRSNERVLAAIHSDLASANMMKADITSDVTSKLIEEISSLEFRRLQSIKVTGYSESHPAVLGITRRINDLKRALSNLDGGRRLPASRSGTGSQALDIKNLYSQAGDLRAKSRVLSAERELLLKEMTGEGVLFKEAVKINFRFDSLVRELTSDSAVTNELYRELQRIRITLAGATPTSALLSPANYNPHAVNLSVRRRTIFGLFVGIAFAMSLLILYEIVRPTLLQADDLEYIKLSHMGTFTRTPRSLSQLAYCIRSLEPPEGRGPGPQVISFLPFASGVDVSEFVAGMAKELAEKGAKVGAVLIIDPDAPATAEQESLWADSNVGVSPLSRDEVPFFLTPTVEELKKKWDFVLIVEVKQGDVPIESYLARCSDHFVYVTQVGDTDLTSVDRVRHLPQLPAAVRHHSIIVHVPMGSHNSVVQGWKRRGDRAA